MPGIKISQMASGAPVQSTDLTVVARGGQNYSVVVSDLAAALLPTLPLNEVALGTGMPGLSSTPDFAFNPITGGLLLNGTPGVAGEVPTSAGPGLPAAWAPAAGGGSHGTAVFPNTGAVTPFVVPVGVTTLYAYGAGTGGGGGGGRTNGVTSQGGGGGGAAGFVLGLALTVTPGDTLTVTNGIQGIGGAANTDGTDGTALTVQNGALAIILQLNGGGGGFAPVDALTPGIGGTGSIVPIPFIPPESWPGTGGAPGSPQVVIGGVNNAMGGPGGSTPWGGIRQTENYGINGGDGGGPGGGGSGGGATTAIASGGGNGGRGYLILQW